jgi:hypothetical protein
VRPHNQGGGYQSTTTCFQHCAGAPRAGPDCPRRQQPDARNTGGRQRRRCGGSDERRSSVAPPPRMEPRAPSPPPHHRHFTQEDDQDDDDFLPTYHKLNFPKFDGSCDTLPWLNRCEHYLRVCQTPDHKRVSYASFHILDDAWLWYHRLELNNGVPPTGRMVPPPVSAPWTRLLPPVPVAIPSPVGKPRSLVNHISVILSSRSCGSLFFVDFVCKLGYSFFI